MMLSRRRSGLPRPSSLDKPSAEKQRLAGSCSIVVPWGMAQVATRRTAAAAVTTNLTEGEEDSW